jgi:hypothetical protein
MLAAHFIYNPLYRPGNVVEFFSGIGVCVAWFLIFHFSPLETNFPVLFPVSPIAFYLLFQLVILALFLDHRERFDRFMVQESLCDEYLSSNSVTALKKLQLISNREKKQRIALRGVSVLA